MMRLTPSSGAPLSRSTTSMVISWSGAATVLTWMLSEPGECAIASLEPANSAGGNDGTALVTDSEGTAVELATIGALHADMESEGLAGRDRRREVPRIEMAVVGFDCAAGPSLGSCVGDAVVGGGHQHNAVSVFAEFDRGGDGDLCAEIVFLEGCERRSADFVAGRVEEQDRITRKIVLFGTFRHGFEGQRSAGIGFLGRNRQAQGDREKNGILTIHG